MVVSYDLTGFFGPCRMREWAWEKASLPPSMKPGSPYWAVNSIVGGGSSIALWESHFVEYVSKCEWGANILRLLCLRLTVSEECV